jgi:hypothetical protein
MKARLCNAYWPMAAAIVSIGVAKRIVIGQCTCVAALAFTVSLTK